MASVTVEYITPAMEDRALQLQRFLAQRGQQREPSIPDLFIAATADLSDRTALPLDKVFDLIAILTQQPTERLDD